MCEGTSNCTQQASIKAESATNPRSDAAGIDRACAAVQQGVVSGPPPPPQQLLQNRKRLIRQTWSLVEQHWNVQLTRAFYQRLFEKHPSTKGMFMNSSIDLQAWKLYEILRVAVKYMDNVEVLLPSIKEMGVRHARAYHVTRSHYNAVTGVFIEVLNEFMEKSLQPIVGDSFVLWRMDVTAAWAWILTLIGSAMADAADEAIKESAVSATSSPSPSPTERRQ
jgi:hemoglobin-like flavoprotein